MCEASGGEAVRLRRVVRFSTELSGLKILRQGAALDTAQQPDKCSQGRARNNNGQSEVQRVLVEAWLN